LSTSKIFKTVLIVDQKHGHRQSEAGIVTRLFTVISVIFTLIVSPTFSLPDNHNLNLPLLQTAFEQFLNILAVRLSKGSQ